MSYAEHKNDNESHRTYWSKKEITPESVRTTHKDYFLEEFFNDLNDVFEYIITESRREIERSWNIKTKKSLYYILVNVGPNHKDIKTIAKELKIPLKNVTAMTQLYWYEIELLQAIFEREVEKIKKLSEEDQMPAFMQLCDVANNANGKFF
jgi:hypothetical protein